MLLLSFAALRAVGSAPRYRLPPFALPDWSEVLVPALEDLPTLVLGVSVREFPEDSNVVRLHPSRMLPTPGQLRHRIEAHLGGSGPAPDYEDNVALLSPDASAALKAALAELRRALN
jgi:hypothetical protein